MLRTALLASARSRTMRSAVERLPPTRAVARRFVAGDGLSDALTAAAELWSDGLDVSVDHLGEDITDLESADVTVDAYLALIDGLAMPSRSDNAEVSIKLSALGQVVPGGGEDFAFRRVQRIVTAASGAGILVTLDMEDHTTTDSTLRILSKLRADTPTVGCVLQAALRRTEDDCRRLSIVGSRVRLCKGAYREPSSVAHQSQADVDASYVRCLSVLMRGDGYPMVATHDPSMIRAALAEGDAVGRPRSSFEFQMLYGVRPQEQRRLAEDGQHVRVYVPYGAEWYGYFMRRLAERPANVALFLHALRSTN